MLLAFSKHPFEVQKTAMCTETKTKYGAVHTFIYFYHPSIIFCSSVLNYVFFSDRNGFLPIKNNLQTEEK